MSSGQVSLEHSKNNSVTSQFWFLLKHLVLLYQRKCLIMLMRPTCKESSYAVSFFFCSSRDLSLLLRTPWMALHSLRALWTQRKSKDWSWELPNFLLTSVKRSASWHCRPGKWILLGSYLLSICLSQVLACLFLEDCNTFQSFMCVFLQGSPPCKVSTIA